jgi:chitinase
MPGPNAPLSDACQNSTQSGASAVAAVTTWTAAGFPASKIVLGVPSYGYVSRSSSTYLQTRDLIIADSPLLAWAAVRPTLERRIGRHVSMHIDGVSGSAAGSDDGTTLDPLLRASGSAKPAPGPKLVVNEDGGTDDGQVQFRDLVKQGILQYIPAWSSAAARVSNAHKDVDAAVSGSGDGDGSSSDDDSGDGYNAGYDSGSEDDPFEGSDSGSGSGSGSNSDPDLSGSFSSFDSGNTTLPIVDATLNALSFAGHQIVNVFTALQGFERKWDVCSSTPYLRSAAAKQVITYDDPQSLEMKAVFARYTGLLGVNMFDIHGDTDGWDLTDAVRRGLGL